MKATKRSVFYSFFLQNSPVSVDGGLEVSVSEGSSPMVTEEAVLDVDEEGCSDSILGVENYSLDIITHMKSVEVFFCKMEK